MGITIHERTLMVQKARNWDELQKHDLTYLEAIGAAIAIQESLLKYALRAERHPDDPDKRADEA